MLLRKPRLLKKHLLRKMQSKRTVNLPSICKCPDQQGAALPGLLRHKLDHDVSQLDRLEPAEAEETSKSTESGCITLFDAIQGVQYDVI